VALDAETGPRSENCHLAHTPLLKRYRMALFVLAMAGELGDDPRPPWLAEIRTWVLSGEPVADIRFG